MPDDVTSDMNEPAYPPFGRQDEADVPEMPTWIEGLLTVGLGILCAAAVLGLLFTIDWAGRV